MHPILRELENEWRKKQVPSFRVGDTVDVHFKIVEGDRQRVQVFSGVVIGRKGGGHRETFRVRRIVQGEGVERIFPLHSPFLVDVKVQKRGKVRRAKLYYLRERVGKATRLRERLEVGAEEAPTPEVKEEKPEESAPASAKAPAGRPASAEAKKDS